MNEARSKEIRPPGIRGKGDPQRFTEYTIFSRENYKAPKVHKTRMKKNSRAADLAAKKEQGEHRFSGEREDQEAKLGAGRKAINRGFTKTAQD